MKGYWLLNGGGGVWGATRDVLLFIYLKKIAGVVPDTVY